MNAIVCATHIQRWWVNVQVYCFVKHSFFFFFLIYYLFVYFYSLIRLFKDNFSNCLIWLLCLFPDVKKCKIWNAMKCYEMLWNAMKCYEWNACIACSNVRNVFVVHQVVMLFVWVAAASPIFSHSFPSKIM